jgi:hypothetical protein
MSLSVAQEHMLRTAFGSHDAAMRQAIMQFIYESLGLSAVTDALSKSAGGTVAGALTVSGALTAGAALVAQAGTNLIGANATPASAVAAGTKGDIAWDATHIYVCVATNSWVRVVTAAW